MSSGEEVGVSMVTRMSFCRFGMGVPPTHPVFALAFRCSAEHGALWLRAAMWRSGSGPAQHDPSALRLHVSTIEEARWPAEKVNVAAWSHANGIFVRAQPCVCGRIAACTQVGGLQAARSLSQQGWFFLECVCVRLCLHCSLCSGSI